MKDIKTPKDIKNMNIDQLNQLSEEIRSFIIDSVSKTGGHLSSNLGVIELTIALHYVFDAPKDKIIFDIGHQCYTHKILTGRKKDFDKLRQYKGLSGFQNKQESEYDCWEAGHSSTSLSSGLGMAIERDTLKENYNVISVIGDGSFANGESSEALNNIATYHGRYIIILNDNEMSINKSQGGQTNLLTKLRISNSYLSFKKFFKDRRDKTDFYHKLTDFFYLARDFLKNLFIKNDFFSNMDIDYLGPIDGHNIKDLIKAFNAAKNKTRKPIIVHVVTKKGKGYCEDDTVGNWHGVGKFNKETKEISNLNEYTYSNVVADKLEQLVKKDNKVFVITPAMGNGSKLLNIAQKYPKQFFDVGIAEEHGATFAAGLANNKVLKPYYVVYSTFSQRCYDQINHDIARLDLPVRVLLDRSGLSGSDGATHHGIFDISIFNSLPNVTITQGCNKEEIEKLLDFSYNYDHPFILRYPKNKVSKSILPIEDVKFGKWTYYLTNKKAFDFIIISYGNDIETIYSKLHDLEFNGLIVNARFIKPIDTELLDILFKSKKPFYIYSTDMINGGLAQQIICYANKKNAGIHFNVYGIDDEYISIGNDELLKKDAKCDIDTMIKDIHDAIR